MPAPQATADLYATLQQYQLMLVVAGRRLWRGMLPDDFDGSWQRIAPQMVAFTSGAQLAAAQAATAYVPAVLEETGQPDRPEARVRPQAFAGVASDGRSLTGLLEGSVVAAKRSAARGLAADEALIGGRKWLETALRSATVDAARDATQAELLVRPDMGYARMVNPPCCSRCAVLAGKWYRSNDILPRHPQCFPAGVTVSGPGHSAATRRWYDGELVVLATASGQNLPLTGNHPVLTSRGWVPANLLQEGDDVVRATAPEGARGLVVPDHHEMPSRVEDVWDALRVAGLRRVPSSPEDFHGDGQYGHVDVVGADGSLRNRRVGQSLGKQVVEREFTSRSGVAFPFDGKGAAELVDLRNAAESHGAVRFGGLGLALLGTHLSGPHRPGLTGATALHAGRKEALRYRSAADAVLARKRKFAGPGLVSLDDLGHRQDPLIPRWDAPGDPFSVQTSAGYASRGLDLLNRLAAQVELDRVVKLRRVQWSGHVYSLTSVEGWHSANSLIVSNCDCQLIPSAENMAGDFTTNPTTLAKRGLINDLSANQRKRIADGADLPKVLNESRDRWRERMAADRRTAKAAAKSTQYAGAQPGQARTVHDFMAHLTNRVDVLNEMRATGIAT